MGDPLDGPMEDPLTTPVPSKIAEGHNVPLDDLDHDALDVRTMVGPQPPPITDLCSNHSNELPNLHGETWGGSTPSNA